MENTSLTTKQLLERWKLLIEHKNDGFPVVLLKDATITYLDNNTAEISIRFKIYFGILILLSTHHQLFNGYNI